MARDRSSDELDDYRAAGTLYPMLHKMVRDGYLTVRSERDGRTARKLYTATEKGRNGLAVARERVRIFTQKGTR